MHNTPYPTYEYARYAWVICFNYPKQLLLMFGKKERKEKLAEKFRYIPLQLSQYITRAPSLTPLKRNHFRDHLFAFDSVTFFSAFHFENGFMKQLQQHTLQENEFGLYFYYSNRHCTLTFRKILLSIINITCKLFSQVFCFGGNQRMGRNFDTV